MLRIFLAFAVIGIIFIMSPERDSAGFLPASDSGRPSAWPPIAVKVEPRAADLAGAAEAVQDGVRRLDDVRRVVIPSAAVPIDMPALRR